jgi:hypothetical protein
MRGKDNLKRKELFGPFYMYFTCNYLLFIVIILRGLLANVLSTFRIITVLKNLETSKYTEKPALNITISYARTSHPIWLFWYI